MHAKDDKMMTFKLQKFCPTASFTSGTCCGHGAKVHPKASTLLYMLLAIALNVITIITI